MAPNLPFHPKIAARSESVDALWRSPPLTMNTVAGAPGTVNSRGDQTQGRKIDQPAQHLNEASKAQENRDVCSGTWAQVAQGPKKTRSSQANSLFQPQVAKVEPLGLAYPTNHLLGIAQEIRETILEYLCQVEEVAGTRPTAYEHYQLACRQTYVETSARFNYQRTVLVPSNRTEEFIRRTLDITILNSNSYHNVKSLLIEICHDAPSNVFCQMAQVLKLSTQLEQLHLFGIGRDGYGLGTSSIAKCCGKYDMSIMPPQGRLHINGQHYRKRLTLVNSIPWLSNLKILVLDNLNMPLLQAHVLSNKPKLEKLHIAADPRTVLHLEYRHGGNLGLGNLVWPVYGAMPPVKELRVDSNAILTASQITAKIASTLESLEWVIPDVVYQTYVQHISFYNEAAILLSRLHLEARRLKELRICLHGPMSESNHQYASFMGFLKDCVSRLQSLQLVELHIHSQSQFFGDEFVDALSSSVTRLYVTDLLVHRDLSQLCASVSTKTATSPNPDVELVDAVKIGDDLSRKDFIAFGRSKLAFVSYEYDVSLRAEAAKKQDQDMWMFLKLNGKLLDKERNRHLESLAGNYIPPKEGGIKGDLGDVESTSDDLRSAATSQEVEDNRNELADCILANETEYFGNEEVAEVVFRHEPVAEGRYYTHPVIVPVEDEFKLCNHWLSK
ncbi:hypothetical protein H2200_006741 [Cladophialophora chaetospira]|uniref:Uncharacterized protein n=1 Tax=Cladophialophora chaetospira TaxID=386627 RepID=A0AA39CHZ1_9EURO|nr:hypothetical protein H2200_006741 [Cladophialophora chaetospira]